jgi:hypothetical protein
MSATNCYLLRFNTRIAPKQTFANVGAVKHAMLMETASVILNTGDESDYPLETSRKYLKNLMNSVCFWKNLSKYMFVTLTYCKFVSFKFLR